MATRIHTTSKKSLKRGVLLIAYNTEECDYYKMAVYTAKRVNKFLNLPVSIITNETSITDKNYLFDHVFFENADDSNYRTKSKWINKGRYKVFHYTPYSETLVLDTDYLINSTQLYEAFNIDSDFTCHKNIRWLGRGDQQEYLHVNTIPALWATVFKFKKTNRAKQIFEMMEIIQNNYEHYANLYRFLPYSFRNDYAMAIALKTVNGHLTDNKDYFWWRLWHINNEIQVSRDSDTAYTLLIKNKENNKIDYIKIKDVDFHMLSKKNFMDLINE